MNAPLSILPLRRTQRGFTIVELLVVIGIIAVLISILVPVTAAVRKKARENGCANNLKQIFQATMLASQEMSGRLPRPPKIGETNFTQFTTPGDFAFVMNTNASLGGQTQGVINLKVGRLWTYFPTPDAIKDIMYCPNDRGERPHTGGAYNGNVRNFSYSFNANIRPTGDVMLRLAEVRRPGARIMVYEEIGPNDAWCLSPGTNQDDWPTNRHARSGDVPTDGVLSTSTWSTDGSGNHLFFDGHVEMIVPRDVISGGSRYSCYGPLTQ